MASKGMVKRNLLTTLVSLCSFLVLIGADFWNPRIEGYRIWVGDNEQTDWIDVCCKLNDQLGLVWADYSPIEEISIIRSIGNHANISLKKAYSLWNLTLEIGKPESAILRLVHPVERVLD